MLMKTKHKDKKSGSTESNRRTGAPQRTPGVSRLLGLAAFHQEQSWNVYENKGTLSLAVPRPSIMADALGPHGHASLRRPGPGHRDIEADGHAPHALHRRDRRIRMGR